MLLSPTTETNSPPTPPAADPYPIDWGDWLPVTGVDQLFERYGSAINPRTSPRGRVGHQYVWCPSPGQLSVLIETTHDSQSQRYRSVLTITGLAPWELWHDDENSWFKLAMKRAKGLRRRLTTLNNVRPLQGLKQMPWQVVDELVWRHIPRPVNHDKAGWFEAVNVALPGIRYFHYGTAASIDRMVRLVASDCEIAGPQLLNWFPLKYRSIVRKLYEQRLAERKAAGV